MTPFQQFKDKMDLPSLQQQPDVEGYMKDYYPESYLEVMDADHEMVRTYHANTIYTDGEEGEIIGINLYQQQLSEEQAKTLAEMDLPHLRSLNLSETPITRFVVSGKMQALSVAVINHNEHLQTLRLEEGLGKLFRLDISFNDLRQFRVPAGCDSLGFISLDGNKELADIRFSGACPSMEIMHIRGGKLKSFHLPDGFGKLAHLYLTQNEIADLKIAGSLPDLSTLQVRNNKLEEIREEILNAAPNLETLYLGENPLGKMEVLQAEIEEIQQQDHLPLIQRYFRQLKVGTPQENNECKVLFIGNGKAGKTQAVRKLVGEPFQEGWKSTHGISLRQLEVESFILNLWDFGGQDMYHNTHRLFMQQNAVYLLFWCRETEENETTAHKIKFTDDREEVKEYPNFPLNYWMDYAYALGKNSPMLVVQSRKEMDGEIKKPEIQERYKEKFPFLEFLCTDSKVADEYDSGYEILRERMYAAVDQVKKGELIPEPYFNMRNWLREQTQAGHKTLDYDSYEAQALDFQIEAPRDLLENWLFKSGVIYYRRDRFNDQIILNQDWAIKAIYTLFDRENNVPWRIEGQEGYFSGKLVREVWTRNGYRETDTHELFINFMISCDLCFEIEDENKVSSSSKSFDDRMFIAPQLLPSVKPNLMKSVWEGKDSYYIKYEHEFLHEGVIQSFVAQTAYLTRPDALWRYGTHLTESHQGNKQEATIEATDKSILVRFTPNSSPLVAKIRNLLEKLQDTPGVVTYCIDGENYQPFPQQKGAEEGFPWPAGKSERYRDLMLSPEGMEKVPMVDFERNRSMEVPSGDIRAIREMIGKEVGEQLGEAVSKIELGLQGGTIAKRKILFVAANPKNTQRLEIDFEQGKLLDELQLGKARNLFEFLPPKYAINSSRFLRIEDDKPYILHFAGHGNQQGIFIQDGQNEPQLASNNFLEVFFEDLKGITELVILNSCLSAAQAMVISQYIPYVVGCQTKVPDSIAVAFSSGVYNGLGQTGDIMTALKRGRKAVVFKDSKAKDMYQVWENGKIRPW